MYYQLLKQNLLILLLCLLGYQTVAQVTISRRINANNNDMEEVIGTGAADIGSSDLELVQESTTNPSSLQIIGLRFTDLNIPKNAVITNAYIQFTTDETKNLSPCTLQIKVQDADNPLAFSGAGFDLQNRVKLQDSVTWTPLTDWMIIGEAGPAQVTSDISTLVQQIVNRNGWNAGQSIAFFFTGSGTRTAEAHDGSPSQAPELVVSYYLNQTVSFL